jgi:hypothetical protein
MQFLLTTDFDGIINANTFAALKGTANADLTSAEALAISELTPLRGRFNVDADLAATGTSRNAEMVRLLVHITAYYLYNKVQDDDIPERITSNYKTQVANIEKIANSKLYTTLTPIMNPDDTTVSNYLFGGDAPRDNEIF